MRAYLPFVVAGLVSGGVYALAALGLVLTYRTTGLFNFAHGAIAMLVAYAFYELRVEWSVPTALSILICLVVVAPAIGFVVDRVLFGALAGASQAAKIVVTVGLLVLLQGSVEVAAGALPRGVAPFLPTSTIKVLDVYVGWDQILVFLISLAVLAGLLVFSRVSRFGVAMRAVVDQRELVRLAGFSAGRISTLTWMLGCMLAGLAGLLFVPVVGLDTVTLTLLVLQAVPAAVFGRLTSLPRTVAAALALGVASSVLLKALSSYPALVDGVRPSLPFILLFGILVFARRGTLRELGTSAPWRGMVRARDVRIAPLAAVLLVATFLIPNDRIFVLGIALVFSCAFLSLTVLTGTSGLISLCNAALAGTGAFTYIHLTRGAHLPWPVALVFAGLIVAPMGLAIAVPALRLSGLFLALATFGFGFLVDGLLFRWLWFSGGADGLRGTRPSGLTSDRAYAYFLVAMLVLFVLAVRQLRRSALGRTLVAMRDSPTATETLGVNLLWPRLAVFTLSAFMAGLAGALYAGLLQTAGASVFSTFISLRWLTAVVVGGVESVLGAMIGGFLLAFVPDLLTAHPKLQQCIVPAFGLGAILLARTPGGLVTLLGRLRPSQLIAVRPRAAARSGRTAKRVVPDVG